MKCCVANEKNEVEVCSGRVRDLMKKAQCSVCIV